MAGKGYQKHVLVGNLGGDPETRATRSGSTVTNFSLAVNETNSNGEEVTTWYRVAAWNGRGEVCACYLTKGRKVLVEGTRLKASAWIDEDGNARASLELTADNVIFLDGPREEEEAEEEVVQPQRKVRELKVAPANGRASRPAAQSKAKQVARQATPNRQRTRGSVALQQEDWEEIPF
ncbi:MAG: single-stranded DNA-binding protein [Ardenticatenales bacterium]|nr:single-stranded DNA-binding protein [Ardenticatenales bacterium]